MAGETKRINRQPLDKFGRFLIENMRDEAISYYDYSATGRWKAPALQKLQADLASLNEEQHAIVRRCEVSAIDTTIHGFLFKLQERADFENDIQVLADGVDIETLSDEVGGDLHGWLYGRDGWMALYSKYGEPPEVA